MVNTTCCNNHPIPIDQGSYTVRLVRQANRLGGEWGRGGSGGRRVGMGSRGRGWSGGRRVGMGSRGRGWRGSNRRGMVARGIARWVGGVRG